MRHPLLPFLGWWRQVDRRTLQADLVAGALGAVLVLPQGIAFAALAGMPPEYGLYCAIVPTAVAALFGSSLHAVSGPTNAVSLFVFAALSPHAVPGSPEFVSLALTLAFLAGALMIALGALRLGGLVNFISDDVIIGFTAGVGILIIASQLGSLLGLALPHGASLVQSMAALVERVDGIKWWVAAVGGLTVAAAVLSPRVLPRVPYLIVSLVAGSVAAYLLNLWLGPQATGIATLDPLARSLPPLSHPRFSLDTFGHLTGSAIALTLIALTQSISIARAIGLRSGQRIDPNQEFIGQGLGNVAASFFSGFPTCASVNRSGPNFEAGARTPLAAVFAAAALAAIVLALAPYATLLPLAAVAGSLVVVGAGLVDVKRIRAAVQASRGSTIIIAVTFFATILLRIEFAVLAGVVASLLLYLHRTSRPAMRSLAPDPRHSERRFAPVEGELVECPQFKILSVEGSIYFGAVHHVGTHLDTLRDVNPGQKHLLLVLSSVNFVDLPGAELLVEEARRRRARGGQLYLYGLRQPVEHALIRTGFLQEIRADNVFRTKHDAIRDVFGRLDREICAHCTARIFLECKGLPPPTPPEAGQHA